MSDGRRKRVKTSEVKVLLEDLNYFKIAKDRIENERDKPKQGELF